MAGPAPKTDKWTARENTQGKQGIVLIVSGLVEVSSSGKEPVLTEASGGGGYGKTLVLDLTIRSSSGDDLQVVMWKRATFSKDVSANHYDNVEIRWDGKTIATVKVLDDDEHHQHLTALTQKANKTAPKPKLPAAKKKAAKKAAPAAPKKGAAKKPAAKKRAAPAAKKKSAKKRPAAKKRSAAKARSAPKKRSTAKKRPAAKKRSAAKARSAPKKRGAASAKKRRSGARRR
jgi:hypothetical protein